MSYDVNDRYGGYYSTQQLADHQSKDGESSPTIISRLRSLFSQTPDDNDFDFPDMIQTRRDSQTRPISDQPLQAHNQLDYPLYALKDSSSFLDMGNGSSTRTGNYGNNATHRFSDVKRIITNFTSSTRHVPVSFTHSRIVSNDSGVNFGSRTGSTSNSSLFSDSRSRVSTSSALTTTTSNTPPLTPDSFGGFTFSPASSFSEQLLQYKFQEHVTAKQYTQVLPQTGIRIQEENHATHDRQLSHTESIKEGKRPQRPIVRVLVI